MRRRRQAAAASGGGKRRRQAATTSEGGGCGQEADRKTSHVFSRPSRLWRHLKSGKAMSRSPPPLIVAANDIAICSPPPTSPRESLRRSNGSGNERANAARARYLLRRRDRESLARTRAVRGATRDGSKLARAQRVKNERANKTAALARGLIGVSSLNKTLKAASKRSQHGAAAELCVKSAASFHRQVRELLANYYNAKSAYRRRVSNEQKKKHFERRQTRRRSTIELHPHD